jgi:tetratricopeptide (TPR) repeat protein
MRRGWVYDRLNRFDDAEADYRAVLVERPQDVDAKLRLAQILRQQGKTAAAAEAFEELVQAGADTPTIKLGLAQSYRDLGRTAEAWQLLDVADESSPAAAAALLEKGKICLAEGRDKDARSWLEKAAALSPGEHDAHYQLFICLNRLGDTAAAARAEQRFKDIEADLTKVGKLAEQLHDRPNDADIRFEIAEVFGRRGEESEATRWLEEVVRLNPAHVKARQTLAEYYERLGKAERARIHRKALAKASH